MTSTSFSAEREHSTCEFLLLPAEMIPDCCVPSAKFGGVSKRMKAQIFDLLGYSGNLLPLSTHIIGSSHGRIETTRYMRLDYYLNGSSCIERSRVTL